MTLEAFSDVKLNNDIATADRIIRTVIAQVMQSMEGDSVYTTRVMIAVISNILAEAIAESTPLASQGKFMETFKALLQKNNLEFQTPAGNA